MANYSVSRRHFVRHLGICNPICVKLLQVMSGVIPCNLKKTTSVSQTVFWRPQTRLTRTHTDRQIHSHDDSIRRNAMRCISPKNEVLVTVISLWFCVLFQRQPRPRPRLVCRCTHIFTSFLVWSQWLSVVWYAFFITRPPPWDSDHHRFECHFIRRHRLPAGAGYLHRWERRTMQCCVNQTEQISRL